MTTRIASPSIPRLAFGQGLTVAGVVAQFTEFPTDATDVCVTVQAASVWVTFDGSDPVPGANGHQSDPGDTWNLSKTMARASKWIRSGSTSAFLYATPLA